MRLLLVERDKRLGEGLRSSLRQAGYAVNWVDDGKAAEAALRTEDYDLVALDYELPQLSAPQFIQRLRHEGLQFPVLVLGDREKGDQQVASLDSGADGFLGKPFSVDELHAMLRAMLRQRGGRTQPLLSAGPLSLDPAARTASLFGRPIELSTREFALLQVLAESAGRVISKSRLEEALYPWNEEVESNAVEVHVHRLRKKLGPGFIRTVRGMGYALDTGKAPAAETAPGGPMETGTGGGSQILPRYGTRPLLGTLRSIFAELESTLEAQQSFTEDVAAELKRPLAAARAQAELAIKTGSAPDQTPKLRAILRNIDEAEQMLDMLVALACVEQPPGDDVESQIDLCELSAQVLTELAPSALQHSVTTALQTPCHGVIVWGKAAMLSLMLRHLVGTVVRGAAPRHRVEVSIIEHDGHVTLRVEDCGATLKAANQATGRELTIINSPRTAQPWHKRREELMLALARRVAHHHGARITWTLTPRVRIEVHFPNSPSEAHSFNWLI